MSAESVRAGAGIAKRTPTRQVARYLAIPGATTALLLMIACYASLLPLGKWHPDEFLQFHEQRVAGWHATADRILGWSPRPVSELVLFGYGTAVNLLGRPLSLPFLAAIWSVLLLGLYFAARSTRREPALIAASLVAAFLLLAKPGEMFYWPAGAAAYLLGITALGSACLMKRDHPSRSWALGGVLVVAAWCAELGAMVVAIDAGLLLVAHGIARGQVRLRWFVWASAAASVAFVAMVTALHRVGSNVDVLRHGSPTIGRLGASLVVSGPDDLRELAAIRLGGGWNVAAGLAVKLLLFLGFRPGMTETRLGPTVLEALLRGTALLLASYGSIVLAYRQFGDDCCERHETFRTCLGVLAVYSFAQAWPSMMAQRTRALLLTVPLLIVFCWRLPDLLHDRALIASTIATRDALWASGRSPGPAMVWRNAPVPMLANGAWKFDPGIYRRRSDAELGGLDWRYLSVMLFFGKTVMTVEPAPAIAVPASRRAG